jgi:hypothetical protein
MYEHPYLAYKVTEYENERLDRAAARRRFLAEHADQIVPRAAGPVRRLGQRMLRAITRPQRNATDALPSTDAVAAAPCIAPSAAPRVARVAALPEPAPAAPADRRATVGCEPSPAR